MSLKAEREAFVSGHTGTSLAEISLVAALPALLVVLARLVSPPGAPPARQLVEFVVLVLPLLVALLGPASPEQLAIGLGAGIGLLLALQPRRALLVGGPETPVARIRAALTTYRASLLLLTCVAILAVDFPAFPRRFAKAEVFGTGLMDAGVGGIVVASGLASGFSIAADPSRRRSSWKRGAIRVAALAVLGLGKAAFVASAGYQTHVGEYGTHWNFFLTLAILQLLSLLLRQALHSPGVSASLGGAVLVVHQLLLSCGGLIDYVHSDERGRNLLAANKEGLLSLPGYWSLQLLSIAAGHLLHRAAAASMVEKPVSRGSSQQVKASKHTAGWQLAGSLAVASAAAWGAYAVAAAIQPVSRRACNAAYVAWMVAFNQQSLALFVGADCLVPGPPPALLAATNGRMLPVFLLANLLTGAVNMSMDTLRAADWTARAVVAVYMAALTVGAGILDRILS